MPRIIVVAFTVLCFTGCATFQPINAPPAPLEQSETTDDGEAGYGGWILLGIAAVLVGVLIASDGGGSGGGY